MNPALDIATATDRVVPTLKLRCEAPRYDPGGGGINVARAVHALGGDALAIFPAGGAAGEMIRHLLYEEGVAHEAIAIAGFTRESLAVEDLRIGNQYRFILPGPEISSADQERCLDQLSRAAAQADYIVASGSLPIGVPEGFYARVAALAKRQAKRLVLDTSGAALKQAGHGIYLLKPSLRELEDLTGRQIRSEREEEQAAREVVAQGRSEVVVVSLGPRGALLASAEGSERFPAMPMQAKSTVGAGDSMLAGIVLDLYRGLQQRVAIARAIVAEPSAILADEPTASLDAANGQAIMTILHAIAKERGRAVLVVTHDPRLFGFADRIVHIEDGSLTREEFTDPQIDLMRSSVTRAR
jgi:6-phosphofructokinase 2